MEEEGEIYEDPRDYEPVTFDFSEETINLLKKRGFFPTESGFIDDKYYHIRKDINANTHLKGDMSVQELVNLPYKVMRLKLFKKDSMIAQLLIFDDIPTKWHDIFGSCDLFYDVEPLVLDPYIAKYVRAINRSGMQTNYSCDGWHKEGDHSKVLLIDFEERYGFLWHKIIHEIFIEKNNFQWNYLDSRLEVKVDLPNDDEGKKQIYNELLRVADFFVYNSEFFKKLKESFVSEINKKNIFMDSLSNSEIEEKMYDYLSKNIKNEQHIFSSNI